MGVLRAVAVRVPGAGLHATLGSMETTDVLTVELFVVLVLVATIVAVVAKRIALPYTVALVLAGLGIAVFAQRDRIEVTPELILAVLIPGLVFEAAYKLDITELRRGFGIVALLAAPGVWLPSLSPLSSSSACSVDSSPCFS